MKDILSLHRGIVPSPRLRGEGQGEGCLNNMENGMKRTHQLYIGNHKVL